MSVWFDKAKARYCVRIQRRGQETRRVLPAGITKAQAEALHASILRDFFSVAELGRKPRYSIADAINRYIVEELPKLRSRRDSDIRAIQPYTVGKPLEAIDEAARAYRADNPHLAPASRNRRCHVLRRIGRLAARWGWLEKPVYVAMEPEHNARHTYYTLPQIRKKLKAIGDPEGQAFATIAAFTGMRRGEIAALARADIGKQFLTIRPATSKSQRPRLVPVVPEIRAALKFVPFTYHKDTYSDMARAAGFRLHDLRHSTASLLLNSGASLEVVGQVLGHASLQTTRRYAHLAPEVARAALLKATRKTG